MIKEIEKTKIKEKQTVVYNPATKHHVGDKLQVLRISTNENYTIVDFIYYAPQYYINGGWVSIDKSTFIRPKGKDLKLTLVKAVNIPMAPNKHYFKNKGDILLFSLYFPAVPIGTTTIDIIECDLDIEDNWFNFYGVSLQNSRAEVSICNN